MLFQRVYKTLINRDIKQELEKGINKDKKLSKITFYENYKIRRLIDFLRLHHLMDLNTE